MKLHEEGLTKNRGMSGTMHYTLSDPSPTAPRGGSPDHPDRRAHLRARRLLQRRRRRLLRVDLVVGVLAAIAALIFTPGLAIAGLVALVLLALCAVSLALERRDLVRARSNSTPAGVRRFGRVSLGAKRLGQHRALSSYRSGARRLTESELAREDPDSTAFAPAVRSTTTETVSPAATETEGEGFEPSSEV